MQQVKKTKWYWDSLSKPARGDSHGLLLSMPANVNRWHGGKIPDKVGTVMLKQSVTLMPQHEHLVWGKLKEKVPLSVGSTVVTEATTARSAPRNVLVGHTVCPLRGDKWVPMKVINMLDHPIVLRHNTKLADVHPCLALEDLELYASPVRSSLLFRMSPKLGKNVQLVEKGQRRSIYKSWKSWA